MYSDFMCIMYISCITPPQAKDGYILTEFSLENKVEKGSGRRDLVKKNQPVALEM